MMTDQIALDSQQSANAIDAGQPMSPERALVLWLETVKNRDVATVGGKNASFGEMIAALLVTAAEVEMIPAAHVLALSAVGAGDSMVGAMTLGLPRGMTMRDAVRYGMAAGAGTAMTPVGVLAHREDTDRIFLELSVEGKFNPMIHSVESSAGRKSIRSTRCGVSTACGAPGDPNGPNA